MQNACFPCVFLNLMTCTAVWLFLCGRRRVGADLRAARHGRSFRTARPEVGPYRRKRPIRNRKVFTGQLRRSRGSAPGAHSTGRDALPRVRCGALAPASPFPPLHFLQLRKTLTIPSIFPHIHLHENHPPRVGRAVPNADQISSAHPWDKPARSPFSSACGAKHGARGGRIHGDFPGRGFALPKPPSQAFGRRFSGAKSPPTNAPSKNSPSLRASFPSVFGAAGPSPKGKSLTGYAVNSTIHYMLWYDVLAGNGVRRHGQLHQAVEQHPASR
jgi:hypothetical protein